MKLILAAAVALFTTSAHAQNTSLVAEEGLAGAIAEISSLPIKTPSDQFALGAFHFLRGIEKTLQTRWQSNTSPGVLMLIADFPVLRLPVPPNPDPKPFEPGLITGLFADLLDDMDASRAALSTLPDGSDPVLELNLMDLWFDINMNNTRDPGEGLMEFAGEIMGVEIQPDASASMPTFLIRFDTADVAWLTAYTELLSGLSELVIAFDPTEPIARVLGANERIAEIIGDTQPSNAMDMQFGGFVDQFAMVYGALNQQPDPEHTRAAHAHFLNMIDANQDFWSLLPQETDDTREWIPNPAQTAALGFDMPAETGAQWQAILADGEAILNGDLLVSYWRIAPAGGVNVKKLFLDPPKVDIVDWVQGSGLLPYLERGPVATSASIRQFENLVGGRSVMFTFLLN